MTSSSRPTWAFAGRLAACLALLSGSATAAELVFSYYEDGPFSMGRGVDQRSPLDLKAVKAFTKPIPVETVPNNEQLVEVKVYTRMDELIKDLDLKWTSTVEGSFADVATFKASKEFKMVENHFIHEDSLIIALKGQVQYGSTLCDSPVLTPAAQKLLDDKNYRDFWQLHGTHFVAQQSKGSLALLLIVIKNLSTKAKQDLTLIMKGGGDFAGMVKVDDEKTMKLLKEKTHRYGSIESKFYGFGLSNEAYKSAAAALDLKLAAELDLAKLSASLANILAGFTEATARPRLHKCVPYTTIYPAFEMPPVTLGLEGFFEQAFFKRLELENKLRRLAKQENDISHIDSAGKLVDATKRTEQQLRRELTRLQTLVDEVKKNSEQAAANRTEVDKLGSLKNYYWLANPFVEEPQFIEKAGYNSSDVLTGLDLQVKFKLAFPELVSAMTIERTNLDGSAPSGFDSTFAGKPESDGECKLSCDYLKLSLGEDTGRTASNEKLAEEHLQRARGFSYDLLITYKNNMQTRILLGTPIYAEARPLK